MKRLITSVTIFVLGMVLVIPLNYAHMDKSHSGEEHDEMHEKMKDGHGKKGNHSMGHNKRHKRHDTRHMGRHLSPLHFKEELDLSEEQIKELKELKLQKKEMNREMIRKRAEITIAETEMSDLLEGDKIDMSEIEKKVKEISELHGNMRLLSIELIIKEKQILTKVQHEKYRELSEIEFMKDMPVPWGSPWGTVKPWEWH